MFNLDLKNIVRLISQDLGFFGVFLKLVNLLFFGLVNCIILIQCVVNLLGSCLVINLINVQLIKGEMSDDIIVIFNCFWDIVQDVVMSCLSLVKWIGYELVDEVYVFGLFYNCGILLMFKCFLYYMVVLEEVYVVVSDECWVVDIENCVLNINYVVVGYYIVCFWCLLEYVCEVIVNYYNVLLIFGDELVCDI